MSKMIKLMKKAKQLKVDGYAITMSDNNITLKKSIDDNFNYLIF